jgi:hypothetical protein
MMYEDARFLASGLAQHHWTENFPVGNFDYIRSSDGALMVQFAGPNKEDIPLTDSNGNEYHVAVGRSPGTYGHNTWGAWFPNASEGGLTLNGTTYRYEASASSTLHKILSDKNRID